jgi:hypothetical protein
MFILQHALIVFLSLVSFPIIANETTVINQSPKASVMTGFAVMLQTNVSPAGFYQSRDCRDAAAAYKKNIDSVIVYETMNVAAAAAKNINCEIDFLPSDVVLATTQYFQFCQAIDRTLPIRRMRTLGMSGMHPYEKWVTELNKRNQMTVKVSVYQGSEATLRGIISKEIDFGFLADSTAEKAKNQGLVQCNYSTNPRAQDFVGQHLQHPINDLAIRVFVLARSNQSVIQSRLQSNEFKEYLKKAGYQHVNYQFSIADLETYQTHFRLLKSFY